MLRPQDEEEEKSPHKKRRSLLTCGQATYCLFFVLKCLDCVLKIFGAFLVFFALALFGLLTFCYFIYIVPLSSSPSLFIILQTAFGLFILFNVLYNHMNAICIDPGLPPRDLDLNALNDDSAIADLEEGEFPKKDKFCKKCNLPKPPRCHHCSMCNRCVLKMDHHCPWINQCVGFFNYRYFLLFLFWLLIGCVFVGITFFPQFRKALFNENFAPMDRSCRQLILLSWMMAVSVGVAIIVLGGFHAYLMMTNQTTIEFQGQWKHKFHLNLIGRVWKNSYNIGMKANVRQVLGDSPFPLWTLPWIARAPRGDGLVFPTLRSTLS